MNEQQPVNQPVFRHMNWSVIVHRTQCIYTSNMAGSPCADCIARRKEIPGICNKCAERSGRRGSRPDTGQVRWVMVVETQEQYWLLVLIFLPVSLSKIQTRRSAKHFLNTHSRHALVDSTHVFNRSRSSAAKHKSYKIPIFENHALYGINRIETWVYWQIWTIFDMRCFSKEVGALHVLQRFYVQRNLRLDIFFLAEIAKHKSYKIPIFKNYALCVVNRSNAWVYWQIWTFFRHKVFFKRSRSSVRSSKIFPRIYFQNTKWKS